MIVHLYDKSGRVDMKIDSARVNYGGLVVLHDLAIEDAENGIVCIAIIDSEGGIAPIMQERFAEIGVADLCH